MSTETVNVYWGMRTAPDRQTLSNLLWKPPVPLVSILPNGGSDTAGNYRKCSAATKIWQNTYALLHPKSSRVEVMGDVETPTLTKSNFDYWIPRANSLKNSYRIDLDFEWLFFAEETVNIQQTPPYLHNTLDRQDGAVASGSFDISQWFRPINITYNLWENKRALNVQEDDPACYLQFITDKKVKLIRFEVTPEIDLMAQQVVQFKMLSPHESLNSLYNRFVGSQRHTRLLNLIKENLVE